MSRTQAHDYAPDCPDCETDLFVGRREGTADGWKCWRCGGWWHDEDADEEAGRLVADGAGHVLIRPANTRSDRLYHHPDPDDPDRPKCKSIRGGTEARRYRRRDRDDLDDSFRLCSHCDPDWEVQRGSDDMEAYQTLAEAEDLDDLRADGGQITACPECDTAAITPTSRPTTAHDWLCTNCQHTFDEPVERERYNTRSPSGEIEKRLVEADDLDDLRADGGTVTVENPELFDRTVRKLRGFADDLEEVNDLNFSASVIRDWARDLEAATRREVDDGE